jgi:alpha-ketoglutarate-dependent 2,4-dichlorophenoxyacetate dioxygenase
MPYGRKALYLGGHAIGIVGWPDEKARPLLDELYAFATQDAYIYRHEWKQDDIVIWDNRCTLHRATPFLFDNHKRDMRRTTINTSGPEISSTDALGIPQPA